MKFKNDPSKLVGDHTKQRGALQCLQNAAFNPEFNNPLLFTMLDEVIVTDGAWLDLQCADKHDEDLVGAFDRLGIKLPKTSRESGTMDNHVGTNKRQAPNGYLHVPSWFLCYLPDYIQDRKHRPSGDLIRVSCLDLVLFLVAIGYEPNVIKRRNSLREEKKILEICRKDPSKRKLYFRAPVLSGPLADIMEGK